MKTAEHEVTRVVSFGAHGGMLGQMAMRGSKMRDGTTVAGFRLTYSLRLAGVGADVGAQCALRCSLTRAQLRLPTDQSFTLRNTQVAERASRLMRDVWSGCPLRPYRYSPKAPTCWLQYALGTAERYYLQAATACGYRKRYGF